ncbi:MAG: hypothetical protein JW717_04070 [Marinilabiliaceae bacterium]|nr:hypothetical protein [Marinilabiliaceae bacterium]
MPRYQKLLFLAISFLSLFQTASGQFIKEVCEPPLLANKQSVLYKVGIDLFGNFFSGLLLIKEGNNQVTHNIAFLTEVGITLCEYYNKDNKIELKKSSSLFQNKSAHNILAEDISMLIYNIPPLKNKRANKYKSKEGIIFWLNENKQIETIKKRRIINGIEVKMENYQDNIPGVVVFRHKGIKFNMKLTLIKTKDKC